MGRPHRTLHDLVGGRRVFHLGCSEHSMTMNVYHQADCSGTPLTIPNSNCKNINKDRVKAWQIICTPPVRFTPVNKSLIWTVDGGIECWFSPWCSTTTCSRCSSSSYTQCAACLFLELQVLHTIYGLTSAPKYGSFVLVPLTSVALSCEQPDLQQITSSPRSQYFRHVYCWSLLRYCQPSK